MITIVGLASVIDGVGLADGLAAHARDRRAAASSAWRCSGRGSRTGWSARSRGSPASDRARRATGFWSGLLVGAALGFVYAPCAGPILAAVISVAATRGASGDARRGGDRLRGGLRGRAAARSPTAGGACSSAPARGPRPGAPARARRGDGRRPRSRWPPTSTCASRPRSPTTCPPSSSTRPGRSSARDAVEDRLADLRGRPRFDARARARGAPPAPRRAAGPRRGARLRRAPGRWFNTPGEPAADAGRAARPRGAGRLLDLHLHQLPPHAAARPGLGRALRARGLTIVGVHTPEFAVRAGRRQRRAGDRAQRPALPGASRTTTTPPGTPGATSTGPPSTWSTPAGGCATRTSARATTARPRRRSARCCARRGDAPRARRARDAGRRLRRARHARDLPRLRAGARLRARAAARGVHATRGAPPAAEATSRSPASGRSAEDSATAVRDAALDARFVARRCSSCSARRAVARARCGCCSTAGRSTAREAGADVHARPAPREEPAPLPARLAAPGRGPPPDPRLAPGRHGLRVHLRVGSP